jgi:predicted RNA-binding Zn-ribbon protein involved in translation (DUF1610 family)
MKAAFLYETLSEYQFQRPLCAQRCLIPEGRTGMGDNVPNAAGQDTNCPGCGESLICRDRMLGLENRSQSGGCPICGFAIGRRPGYASAGGGLDGSKRRQRL